MAGVQAGIIDRINEQTSQMAMRAQEGEGRPDVAVHLRSLLARPLWEFFRAYISCRGPLGGKAAIQTAVNVWAREFILAAKIYERHNYDGEKSIVESRDFS